MTTSDESVEALGLPYAEAMIAIARPIDDVFGFLADGINAPRWMSWVIQSTPVGYGGGVGATYSQRTAVAHLGRTRLVYRTVHYHPPITLGVEATSLPGRPTARFHLSPTEPGTTKVTVHAEFTDGGATSDRNSVSGRWATQVVGSLPLLKSELESGMANGKPA
jgi:hypothetical protein